MTYLYRPGNQWWAGSRRLEQWRGCLCKCWCSRCWSWCYHLCWAVDDCSRRGYYRLGSCCCRPAAGRAGDGESAQTRCCWCANSPRWSPFRSPAVGSVPVDRRLLHRRHRRRSQNDRHRLRPPCNRSVVQQPFEYFSYHLLQRTLTHCILDKVSSRYHSKYHPTVLDFLQLYKMFE